VKNIFISQQGGIFELRHIVIKVNGYDFYSVLVNLNFCRIEQLFISIDNKSGLNQLSLATTPIFRQALIPIGNCYRMDRTN